MAYEKLGLSDGNVLTSAHVDHIENGIVAMDTKLGDVDAALDEIIAIQNELIGGES